MPMPLTPQHIPTTHARRTEMDKNVIVKDHTGRVLFQNLVWDGVSDTMKFRSGYGFVSVYDCKRNHWTIEVQ
jgi:hypothetical protein